MTVVSSPVVPVARAFEVEVVGVVRLSPTFLRVSFGGGDLREFRDPGPLGPRDLRIKVIVPPPGGSALPLADLSDGWYQRWRALPPEVRGTMRTFTVRRTRLAGPDPQIDVDFALHGDGAGRGGPATSWAATARPGDTITLIGPNAGGGPGYGGIEWQPAPSPATSRTRVLLVGDETAAPAVCSILETLPPGYDGHAILEVPHAEDFQHVRTRAEVEVRWLARGDRPRGRMVDEAVRDVLAGSPRDPVPDVRALPDLDVDRELLWESPGEGSRPGPLGKDDAYAWVAGEAAMVRAVRRYLVHEQGLDRRSVAFMGYWRCGRAQSS